MFFGILTRTRRGASCRKKSNPMTSSEASVAEVVLTANAHLRHGRQPRRVLIILARTSSISAGALWNRYSAPPAECSIARRSGCFLGSCRWRRDQDFRRGLATPQDKYSSFSVQRWRVVRGRCCARHGYPSCSSKPGHDVALAVHHGFVDMPPNVLTALYAPTLVSPRCARSRRRTRIRGTGISTSCGRPRLSGLLRVGENKSITPCHVATV